MRAFVSRFLNFEKSALDIKTLRNEKMCSKQFQFTLLLAIFGLSLCQDEYQRIPIVALPRRPPPELVNNNLGWGSGFMGVARNFVSSPSGQLAGNTIARL